ncbi:MAG: hypothetical protein U0165_03125 [Polyangiaceae bacterium]
MAGQVVFPSFPTAIAGMVRGKRLQSLLPRMAPCALRVPSPVHAQDPAVLFPLARPQVFVHEGARQALERRFEQAHEGPVTLHINDNTHSIVAFSKRGEQLREKVHHMCLDAPGAIQEALVRYAVSNDRDASHLIGQYIAAQNHRIRASRPPLHPLTTKGEAHDLLAIFQRLNRRYFGNTHDALITWGRKAPRRASGPRKSIKLGSYSAIERLIRVHPALDKAWVPRYFVEYVIFHEMLHHVIPSTRGARSQIHPPEFRARERELVGYERAIRWEREHIERLLRA